MDVEPSCVLQVELMAFHGTDLQEVLDVFHFDMEELLALPDIAVDAMLRRVHDVFDRTETRLAYLDDEGDWCTLNKETLSDAIQFAKLLEDHGLPKIYKLQVRIMSFDLAQPSVAMGSVAVKMEPIDDAPVSSSSSSSQDHQKSWEDIAFEELNALGANTDMRRLLPKLAAAALNLIEEVQFPELFEILDILSAFRDGHLAAERLPAALPEMAATLRALPQEVTMPLLMRFREEAYKAAVDMKEEDATASKDIEVHVRITCDGCEATPLLGPRWKSLTHDDYDLCEACYRKGDRNPADWKRIRSEVFGSVQSSFYGQVPEAVQEVGQEVKLVLPLTPDSPVKASLEAAEESAAKCSEEASEDSDTSESEEEERTEKVVSDDESDDEVAELPSKEVAEESMKLLLSHRDKVVRKAARAAIEFVKAQNALRTDEESKEEVQKATDDEDMEIKSPEEESDSEDEVLDEWAMAERSSSVHSDTNSLQLAKDTPIPDTDTPIHPVEEAKESKPVPETPSAKVASCTRLILGVEAEEDEGAYGDVTAEFEAAISVVGAKQAFRLGRVAVPTGSTETTVPICAKIVVVNNGKVQWPESTAVAIASGEAFGFPYLQLGPLNPGEAAEVILDLAVPLRSQAEMCRSSWAIVDMTTSAPLGPVLLFEVIWTENKQ